MDVLLEFLCRYGRGLLPLLVLSSTLLAQPRDEYIMTESGRLEMVVYIIGEIKRPGEYQVPDDTNLLELISKAGGPTEFSNMSKVMITRIDRDVPTNGRDGRLRSRNKIVRYDVAKYLQKSVDVPPPVLKPGDTILVPRNSWHKWRMAFTIVRDLAVIASVYLLYLRVSR